MSAFFKSKRNDNAAIFIDVSLLTLCIGGVRGSKPEPSEFF
jgi:hypothetical protein